MRTRFNGKENFRNMEFITAVCHKWYETTYNYYSDKSQLNLRNLELCTNLEDR